MLFDQIIAISHYPPSSGAPEECSRKEQLQRSGAGVPSASSVTISNSATETGNVARLRHRLLLTLKANPPTFPACNGFEQILAGVHQPLTQKQVRDSVRMRASDVSQSLATLIANGRVIKSADR
jgi:hypothetical protein